MSCISELDFCLSLMWAAKGDLSNSALGIGNPTCLQTQGKSYEMKLLNEALFEVKVKESIVIQTGKITSLFFLLRKQIS